MSREPLVKKMYLGIFFSFFNLLKLKFIFKCIVKFEITLITNEAGMTIWYFVQCLHVECHCLLIETDTESDIYMFLKIVSGFKYIF